MCSPLAIRFEELQSLSVIIQQAKMELGMRRTYESGISSGRVAEGGPREQLQSIHSNILRRQSVLADRDHHDVLTVDMCATCFKRRLG